MSPQKHVLKISQLAEKAGVTVPTVKHYVREGLLPRPEKTSRNMAYYSDACIDRIKLVKKLQKEKFLPLDVIKRLLDSGEALDEELALGKALLKADRFAASTGPVRRSKIAGLTGYSLEKIDILEKEGLIHPQVEGDLKTYPPEDVDLIHIMKSRDDMGVPVDTSLATLRIYRDALTHAVSEDINFFVRNTMGDIPTRQAIRFITEADETLDRFIISYRQKMLKLLSEKTIKTINRLPEDLATLNILPIAGTELPDKPPDEPFENALFHLLQGNYDVSINTGIRKDSTATSGNRKTLAIFSMVMVGDTDKAVAMVRKNIPQSSFHLLENTVAALAYLFAISSSSGLSVPMFNIKKVFSYLKRVEQIKDESILVEIFARYVCGAVYLFLPGVFNTRHTGIEILSRLKDLLESIGHEGPDTPEWLTRTFAFEIVPALKIRINRFLAQGFLKTGDIDLATACLGEVIDMADPDSEHAAWAKLERVRIAG